MGASTARIRPIETDDAPFLRRMLQIAIYVADGEAPVPESILDQPELHRYIADFGDRFGDLGLIAEVAQRPVGACWIRLFPSDAPGYGFVAADVPELTIALDAEARGRGLGTELIEAVLTLASDHDFERVSLSVDERSPALALYERLGFEHVGWEGTSMTMTRPTLGL